jgi:hypothetical protein
MTSWLLASAPVTNWPARVALTLLLLAMVLGLLALMRRAWVRRGARQSDIEPLPAVPPLPTADTQADDGSGAVDDVEARYLGATRAGDWLDRVVAQGLGTPSAASIWVRPDLGVWISRRGAPDLFLAATQVVGVRHDRAMAGRVLERDGVLVITWRLGASDLDLGLRVRAADEAERVRAAVARTIEDRPAPITPATTGDSA